MIANVTGMSDPGVFRLVVRAGDPLRSVPAHGSTVKVTVPVPTIVMKC